jgi:hypothetical protein
VAKKIPKIVKEIQKNPPQAINFAYQKNISFSQMSIFRGCPHRWKLQYKDKVKRFTSSIHTVFGTAIHETIQEYLDIMYTKAGTVADKLNLEDNFQDYFVNEYQKQYKANNNQHFSSSEEMREFFEDGVSILNWFRKKKSAYFSKRGWHLVGCEIPITVAPNKMYNNVLYLGYLDVVMYHEPTNTFKIIDLKTSTRGWREQDKNNEDKQFQLLLYKQFFAEQYNLPIDSIEIEFFILKRKVLDVNDAKLMSPYQAHRVQRFTPPSGKIKIGRAKNAVNSFIQECFSHEGKIKDIKYPKQPSKWNCNFCPFSEDKEHCGEGIAF